MRVPKGTVPHGETEDGENWEALVAKAKALAAEEDDDDWAGVIASARSRVADEEREWAEAMARAKRIVALEPSLALVGKRPQRPQRPPRPVRKPALVPPALPVAQARSASALVTDEEAEWQRVRAQAGLRLQEDARIAQSRATSHDIFGALVPVAAPAKPALRVVAWP